jgi:hypothetical protein
MTNDIDSTLFAAREPESRDTGRADPADLRAAYIRRANREIDAAVLDQLKDTVYVAVIHRTYEGHSAPLAIFDNKKDARIFAQGYAASNDTGLKIYCCQYGEFYTSSKQIKWLELDPTKPEYYE